MGEFAELWKGLTRNQQRFAVAMLDCPSKKEAAGMVGISDSTVYRWGEDIDRVIELLLQDAQESALTILAGVAVRAAVTKQDGLDSEDERIKQGVATEILDRVLGRATQRQEISGPGGEPMVLRVKGFDDV